MTRDRVDDMEILDLPGVTSWLESISTSLKVGVDLTISSPFTEESVTAQNVTRSSKTLEFLGGLALGFMPIVLLIYIEIFTNLMLDSLIQIFISAILVISLGVFAFVKRKNAMGAGILVGFFGGFALVFVLVIQIRLLAFSNS
jgi:hypothetical protein